MQKYVLKAKPREASGTQIARRERRSGWIPANLYGHGEANAHLLVPGEELSKIIKEGHHMVTLECEGKEDAGLLKEVQYDAVSGSILHADFSRVSMDETVEMLVTVQTFGIPKGLVHGGILDVVHPEILVRGKVRDMPESIKVEVSHLELSESIRVQEIELPEGVEAILGAEQPVIIVHAPRGIDLEGEEEAATEPEVIGEKKKDEE